MPYASPFSRISRLRPFSPSFTSNPACAISRFQNPEIRGQTTEDRKKLLNRRQTRTNTDRHSPADFLFFGTRVPHGWTHGYSRIKDGSAKNAKQREDEDRLKASRMAGVPIRPYRGKWGTLKDKNKLAYFWTLGVPMKLLSDSPILRSIVLLRDLRVLRGSKLGFSLRSPRTLR